MLKLLVLYFAFGPSFFHLSTARRSVTSTTVTSTSTTVTSTSSTVTSTSANKVPHIVTPTPASQTLPTPTAPLSGPGITIYPQVSYQGRETFLPIPSVALLQAVAIPSGGSFKISDNVVVAVQTDETTFVLSGASASCPNTAELPSNAQSSFVFGIQSTTCWPPCAPNGSCHPNGKCICAEGYAGHLCESCDKGFFGPECHGRCPKDCAHCDDGLAGSGVCNETPNPTKCNCVHGFCDANGQCQCNSGWTGTKCTECAPGYYVSADRCRGKGIIILLFSFLYNDSHSMSGQMRRVRYSKRVWPEYSKLWPGYHGLYCLFTRILPIKRNMHCGVVRLSGWSLFWWRELQTFASCFFSLHYWCPLTHNWL